MRNCVLVVERDPSVSRFMQLKLEEEGFSCLVDNIGDSVVDLAGQRQVDIIVLDPDDPMEDGDKILENVREISMIPVIYLSSDGSVDRKVEVLNAGADDYLTKPFHLAELNARVKSVIRRRQAKGDVSITVGNLLLYPDKRQVEVGGVPLQLNRKEFDLLYYFIVNPNRVINKMSLAESVWGDNIDQADSLDFIYSQVKNLRRKLKQADATVELKAVYGFGYKLSES